MRARHAFTSAVDVTVPALMRAEASASVRPESASASFRASAGDDGAEAPDCCGKAAARLAAAAAPRTVTVNSRRERCVMVIPFTLLAAERQTLKPALPGGRPSFEPGVIRGAGRRADRHSLRAGSGCSTPPA